MWDGFNKRKFPRVALHCEIIIRPETQTTPISAVTENVGAGGVCVILEEPIERFTNCRVRFALDEKLPRLDCLGRVVWTVPTKALGVRKSRFDTGIEFLNLESDARAALRAFIETHPEKEHPALPR